MATLSDTLQEETDLTAAQIEWLRLLVGDWQIISDLTFADLILWVPTSSKEWVAVAQSRPTTGRMVFVDDIVGTRTARKQRPLLNQVVKTKREARGQDPSWLDDDGIREEVIPVVCNDEAIAVISRCTNPAYLRIPSRLELTYIATGDALCRMVSEGSFPHREFPSGHRRGAPRVSDGLVRLDTDGTVTYASPNAVSCLHRLGHVGDVVGSTLAEIATELVRDHSPVDETMALVVTGRAPWSSEVETAAGHVTMRAVPLLHGPQRVGAAILMRDVTELRRRERQLLTKDATIREIHHRVKNNLQSVAAVLRLQARRLPEGDARAALDEAVLRVGTIALVHEMLSRTLDEMVDFDDVVRRTAYAVVDVARGSAPVETVLRGRFGRLRAEDATSLAMVITELVANAVEHGFGERGGVVTITATRTDDGQPESAGGQESELGGSLNVVIEDDGAGLPEGFSPQGRGLGTQIVTSLVADLHGWITWSPREGGGARVEFTARLRTARDQR